MKINCSFDDICDCKAIPIQFCRTKQIVEYCLKEKESESNKIDVINHILEILTQ